MSRKAFLIWGFVIIHLDIALVSIAAYLGLSRVIDLKAVSPYIGLTQLIIMILGFGIILFLRFKSIGRRKGILAACLPFWFFSIIAGGLLTAPLMDLFRFTDHGMMPIVNAAVDGQIVTTWMKMKFVLLMIPAHYLAMWGLFALLWFGSLDPRTPSKNGFIRFMKHGFQRKIKPREPALSAHLNEAVA